MAATVFDTLAAARKLKAAGVEAAQAEAHAETIADAIAGGGLATKTDIARLEGKIADAKFTLLLAFLVGLGLLFAALKLFP